MKTALHTCPNNGNDVALTATRCLLRHDWAHNTILYQPASRFWPFQFIESAIYLGMAVALLGVTIWWIRTRLA